MKKGLLLIIVLLLASNSNVLFAKRLKKQMDSWKGRSRQELYMEMGPADAVTSDGSDGEIQIYANHICRSAVKSATGQGYVVEPVDYWEWRMFYNNANQTIYAWKILTKSHPPFQREIGTPSTDNVDALSLRIKSAFHR